MSDGLSQRECEVCGASARSVLYRQRFGGDLEGGLLGGYAVAICDACGFGYADGLPPQNVFDEYYARMSKYENARAGGRESAFARQRFQMAARFIKETAPDISTDVLDVGCSSGGLLHALALEGFDGLLGLDPSPTCAAAGRDLYGLHIETGTLTAPPAGLRRSGLILLSAVLEHIRDLSGALGRVRGLLRPGGAVYVEVPDVTRFGVHPDAPFQEFSVEHVNYFSRTSLRNLFARVGFSAVSERTVTTVQGEGSRSDVIMAMFRAGSRTPGPPEPDAETRAALTAYISVCRGLEAGISAALAPWVDSDAPILVWGVGTHTQRLLADGPLARVRIAAFVDSNPRYQDRSFHGLPVIAPGEVAGRTEPILVSSRFFQQEIVRQIRDDLSLTNELITLYRV